MPNDARSIALINDSFYRLTGKKLVSDDELIAATWEAPRVILAHGTEADPIFFYGNQMALRLFEVSQEELLHMPSRLSAEAPQREIRESMLARVARDGFIADYCGTRVSATGKRFRIEQAIVWNLIDEDGKIHGQAATFDHWVDLA